MSKQNAELVLFLLGVATIGFGSYAHPGPWIAGLIVIALAFLLKFKIGGE